MGAHIKLSRKKLDTHIEQVALFFSSIIENNFFSTRICQKKDFF